jgi:hypothetical protein
MPTTIQVSDETKRLLDSLKRERHLRSYDEMVQGMAGPLVGTPKSLFGSLEGAKPFRREREVEHEP